MTCPPGDLTQFIIMVHPHDSNKLRRFHTRQIILLFGVEPLRGRGTHVFEAIRVDEGGKEKGDPVVLKDIWIDHDHLREGVILMQLYKEADEDDKLMQRHFLAAICHGDVLMEPGVPDNTQDLMC
ncbi:hypothetical protein BS47DRAFT_1366195 [Hydnum rufescens UP504]|uniref:Fungal-type protein kinase domain-containing protein n=1 Tax=Hydnum rufescens UP504 TaxID=1448309 RepID=A0A9P6DRZ8_9AGAM|nr:hypothetical protein BS47DRAFT_1366195 [Hydnum rufescens UP504]